MSFPERGGEDKGLSLPGDEDGGVEMSLGLDPRVAIWEGEDGGFVDRVKYMTLARDPPI